MRSQHFLCKCERRILTCKNCIKRSGTIRNYAKYCNFLTMGTLALWQNSAISAPMLVQRNKFKTDQPLHAWNEQDRGDRPLAKQ